MSKFLSEVKGFTPVIDVVAQDVGLIEAVVYGVIWRYCQMSSGVCQASLQTIAEKVKLNRRTVIRHIQSLIEAGYIEDTTPDLKHRPHTYRDTGKVKITGLVEAKTGVTESHTSDVGVTESHTRSDRKSQVGVTESHLKKQDTSKETDIPDGRSHFLALAEVCQIDLELMTTAQRNQLGQSSKLIKKKGETADKITKFGKWWSEYDWRGKKGQVPTPALVRSEWGKFEKSPLYNGTSLRAYTAR